MSAKYHLNFYVEKNIEDFIKGKAELLGLSISAVSNMYLLRGIEASKQK